jgi:hypothetical protein
MTIHKEYEQPFVLEPTKFTRLVDIIHDRLADHPRTAVGDSFEAFFNGDRHEEIPTLNEVLALDNSRKHKIERLVVLCSGTTTGAPRPEHEIQVDFGYPKPNKTSTRNTTKAIAITVRSDAGAWASRTLAELEEQVERTRFAQTRHITALVILAILLSVTVIVLILSPFLSIRRASADTWWLNNTDAARIEQMLKEQPVLTDEQLREISTMQLRNIVGFPRPQNSTRTNELARVLFLVVPLSVVVVCIFVLLITCYPTAVFLWGDEVERYANILQRRKLLWNIIVGVTVVGVLSKFFFEGLASWFPRR